MRRLTTNPCGPPYTLLRNFSAVLRDLFTLLLRQPVGETNLWRVAALRSIR